MSEYPKWIKATVPGAGEVDLVAESKAEEDAVLDGSAVFRIIRAAPDSGGVSYTIELPQAKAKKAAEPEPFRAPAPPVMPKHVPAKPAKAKRR